MTEFTSEILKSCKRCESLPKFSYFNFDGRQSASVVCCTTITSGNGGGVDMAISKWNHFNIEAKNTFKYNRTNKQWELYSEGK